MRQIERDKLIAGANLLALLTIGYNFVEGVVSMALGAADETLALFGFGVDSFIEVISAVGVWHMIRRIRQNGGESRDAFEQRALRITGGAFYLLTAGLVATALLNMGLHHKPTTTFWGIVVALVSISFMWLLIHHKIRVGTALNSPAILADAACSKACVYLSVVLLLASVGFLLTGIGYLDAVGALLIAWLTWREGKEAFGKARGLACTCSCNCGQASEAMQKK
jgi:divalent metal cation (Fe/Co/Zn/Cd) transporter